MKAKPFPYNVGYYIVVPRQECFNTKHRPIIVEVRIESVTTGQMVCGVPDMEVPMLPSEFEPSWYGPLDLESIANLSDEQVLL